MNSRLQTHLPRQLRAADWLLCNDPDGPKWRATQSGAFPLASRSPGSLEQISAYGNALCAPQAIGFVKIAMEYLRPGESKMKKMTIEEFNE